MKKFIKWFILLVVLFIPSFSSANYTNNAVWSINLSAWQSVTVWKDWANSEWMDTFCFTLPWNSTCSLTATNPVNWNTCSISSPRSLCCMTWYDNSYWIVVRNTSSNNCPEWTSNFFFSSDWIVSQYTSL